MPFGDGTGPRGIGPMTGRGAGYCTGFGVPGYANPALRRGWFGYGRGAGLGYSRGFGVGIGRGFGRGRGYSWRTGYGYSYPYARYDYPVYGADYGTVYPPRYGYPMY